MTTRSELFEAVTEIIDVMGLIGDDKEPMEVADDATVEELTEIVNYGVDNIDPTVDEFSETTQAIIDKFAYAKKRKKTVPIEEDVEEVEEEEEFDEKATVEKIHQQNVGKKTVTVVEQVPADEEEEEEEEEEVVVKKPARKASTVSSAGKTEFGHKVGSQAGDIDELILKTKKAMSIAEMAKALNLTEGRVDSHIKHLKRDKGVEFVVKDGKYSLK